LIGQHDDDGDRGDGDHDVGGDCDEDGELVRG